MNNKLILIIRFIFISKYAISTKATLTIYLLPFLLVALVYIWLTEIIPEYDQLKKINGVAIATHDFQNSRWGDVLVLKLKNGEEWRYQPGYPEFSRICAVFNESENYESIDVYGDPLAVNILATGIPSRSIYEVKFNNKAILSYADIKRYKDNDISLMPWLISVMTVVWAFMLTARELVKECI